MKIATQEEAFILSEMSTPPAGYEPKRGLTKAESKKYNITPKAIMDSYADNQLIPLTAFDGVDRADFILIEGEFEQDSEYNSLQLMVALDGDTIGFGYGTSYGYSPCSEFCYVNYHNGIIIDLHKLKANTDLYIYGSWYNVVPADKNVRIKCSLINADSYSNNEFINETSRTESHIVQPLYNKSYFSLSEAKAKIAKLTYFKESDSVKLYTIQSEAFKTVYSFDITVIRNGDISYQNTFNDLRLGGDFGIFADDITRGDAVYVDISKIKIENVFNDGTRESIPISSLNLKQGSSLGMDGQEGYVSISGNSIQMNISIMQDYTVDHVSVTSALNGGVFRFFYLSLSMNYHTWLITTLINDDLSSTRWNESFEI